jgi:hypothetical protein
VGSVRLALAAAAALLIVSVGLVWWWTRPVSPPVPTADRVAAAAPPPGVAEAMPAGVPATPQRPPPGAIATARQATPLPATGPWEAIAPVSSRRLPAISNALQQAEPALALCYDVETQARYGRQPYSTVGTTMPGTGGTTFLVNLEVGSSGKLRVVDAPVESRGAAEDGLIACVQETLRRQELGASSLAPGSRLRVRYPLPALIPTGSVPTRAAPRVRLKPR